MNIKRIAATTAFAAGLWFGGSSLCVHKTLKDELSKEGAYQRIQRYEDAADELDSGRSDLTHKHGKHGHEPECTSARAHLTEAMCLLAHDAQGLPPKDDLEGMLYAELQQSHRTMTENLKVAYDRLPVGDRVCIKKNNSFWNAEYENFDSQKDMMERTADQLRSDEKKLDKLALNGKSSRATNHAYFGIAFMFAGMLAGAYALLSSDEKKRYGGYY